MELILTRSYYRGGTNGVLQSEGKELCHTIELPWKDSINLCLPQNAGDIFIDHKKLLTMSNRLSKQHFWEWFKRNNKEYLELHKKNKKEDKYWTNEIKAHLRAHGRYMKFSIQWEPEKNAAILTITSGGKSRFFERIEEFVAKAPQIPNWEIQALEPPQEVDFLIEERFGYTGINVNDLRFVKGEEDSNIFVVYHPLYIQEDEDLFIQIATAATYNVLGERLFGLNIDRIEIDNLSRAPKGWQLLRLEKLPALLENGYSSLIVDTEGNIKDKNI